ncbi:NAD(P)/FAD-dependent oxidoreductase [Iningainema tapete]|uniref:NAD(P)/FAD-dependent oxidoreductase n=1 Tax=Iningainema tapete BLCC-T55 TaxID=2748662 RepID=A0A8J6XFF9_9CYAN|nr:NAD(P)/FAD-dependent oxidoreductase [Iningainema tapete]MBD2772973.1 NAD(P)/FAD-dependent oxidoreductase [Iningainema tapete BLCC-T55]
MKIGIIGGGMMGLASAYRLSQKGHKVTVFESNKQLGGLTTYHDYGLFVWDRFYHVILPSDTYLINFLQEIGLGDKLRWRRTLTGCYIDSQLYSISNTVEFFLFPPLSLIGKIRLAFTLLYGSRIKNWRRLEQISVEDWLLKISGKNAYEKLWQPLLLAKLGESYKRVSAVFIWSYIKRLFSARDSSSHKEQLGYVEGGYKTVFDRLENLICSAGGEICTYTPVEYIAPHPQGGIWVEYKGKKEHFDKVIFTGPVNILQSITANHLVKVAGDRTQEVEYLGVICMALITRKALVPYYIVNIADQRVPFTGLLGMSNLVSLEETDGMHLTYLPKYLMSDDPLLQQTDEELKKLFFRGLRLIFPELNADDIVACHINRAFKMQPLQVLNYSSLVPKIVTEHDDFFVLNNSQFVNDTLNNNTVVKHVDEFMKKLFLGVRE